MSQGAWDQIQAAMNDVMTLINQASGDTRPDAPALELSKRIFERIIQKDRQPTADALKAVKGRNPGHVYVNGVEVRAWGMVR